MFSKLKWAAVALPVIVLLAAGGCGTPTSHPNQLSAFDGATYDSLTLTRAALFYLRETMPAKAADRTALFNQANAAYGVAFASYSSFRARPTSQAEVALAIGNLTVAVVALENALQADLHAAPQDVVKIRKKANRLRTSAKQAGVTVSDVLTELEIAAAVAATIAPSSPYAALAQMVIGCTNAALAAETAAAGQPIDLTTLAPLAAL